jgi:UPF0271 protein
MKYIDLNCDMGELPEAIADGTQESLMPNFTSVNIACGGHAGDAETMKATIAQALRWKLAIGAHPGYPDRANFGRVEMNLSPETLANQVYLQVGAFARIAASLGATVSHIKAHGALYNQAAKDRPLAKAFANGVARWSRDVVLVGLAGSNMLEAFREAGFRVAAEAFADRRYQPDGSLRPRKFEDALIGDASEAAQQALRIVQKGMMVACDGSDIAVEAQTICIHGDAPNAVKVSAAVAQTLRKAGIALRGLS